MTEREELFSVFRTPSGQRTLMKLLKGSYLFDRISTEEQMHRRNHGLELMKALGMLEPEAIEAYLSFFFQNPPKNEGKGMKDLLEKVYGLTEDI